MIPFWSEVKSFILKVTGSASEAAVDVQDMAKSALLATAQFLLTMKRKYLVTALHEFKKHAKRRAEARTKIKEAAAIKATAEAEKLLAEAMDKSTKATLHKRNDRLARIEKRQKLEELRTQELQNEKIRGEIEKLKHELEMDRIKTVSEAQERLILAVAKLRAEGGDLVIDVRSLKKLLNLPPDQDQDPSQ